MLKVVFIGGLENGHVVYKYLRENKHVSLDLAITYPDGSDKPKSTRFCDEENIIKDVSANRHLDTIRKLKPDYIFVAGWSELLDTRLISIPVKGTIGFHPSKLPLDRGRSVLAWQIEEGYTETALTMFYYNELPDCGDIIAQEKIAIEFEDTVDDVLNKVTDATNNLMKAYFPLLRHGIAPRSPQNIQEGNFRRLRKEKDGEIDWNKNSMAIYNKIRAITRPYPGAKGVIAGSTYRIWKSEICMFPFGNSLPAGDVAATLFDGSMVVKTRNGFIRLTEFDKI